MGFYRPVGIDFLSNTIARPSTLHETSRISPVHSAQGSDTERQATYRWQVKVEACAHVGRDDVVAEEAAADPAAWLGALAVYREADYRTEAVALAVSEAVSQLGALDRYLRLVDDGEVRRRELR
ncbi:zeta toxin family protein [Streptomyces atratus]|uniref:zeta toxin family protein n=1 Tax=Streptomyces atratus TaxID=1893 RepID=UPI00365514FC